jgi:hypothetical protein
MWNDSLLYDLSKCDENIKRLEEKEKACGLSDYERTSLEMYRAEKKGLLKITKEK